MTAKPVQICRGFTDQQWKMLRERLDGQDEPAWNCAIEVFERRIRERFLSCIEALIDADSKLHVQVPPGAPADCSTLPADGQSLLVPGFSIMALCCLLAETLQGFREAPAAKPAVSGTCTYPAGQCIKPSATDQFREFLRRPAFRNEFDDEKVAKKFVGGVRNGIFHEAETRGWVIQRDQPAGQIVEQKSKRYALNRSEFYKALKTEFDVYLQELRSPRNSQLRSRFVKKMTDIANDGRPVGGVVCCTVETTSR